MIYCILIILSVINIEKAVCSNLESTSVPFFTIHVGENVGYIIFSVFVLVICAVKVWYTWAQGFAKIIPESNLLLFCGILLGLSFNWIFDTSDNPTGKVFAIDSDRFFNVLLPPIILEASFAMYHKTFASNIVGVLVFAVIATLFNFVFIGLGLTYISSYSTIISSTPTVNVSTFWVFSALIVAVDPVAVLAIFQEIHVDNNLYYLVFGESLLNDGVSVVLYETMIILSKLEIITANDIGKTILSFFLVCVGGGLVGCVISVCTCLITRFTFKTPLTEPILVLFFGYLAYLLAGMIKWSGIISMIVYGMFQATYGFQNITQKSLILIKRLSKILSNISEAVIFINLGVSVTKTQTNFASNFTFWSIFLCLYGRFLFTLLLSYLINYFEFNIRKIAWNEQFIIAYGGLRGGIAYCLSFLIDESTPINISDIQQTTMSIILFTIFFMGLTMKPLVRLLNIQIAKPDELSLFVQISESAIDHLLAGIEEVIGMKGRNSIHEFLANIDELYIRPFLQRDPLGREEKIMKVFEKMNLTMHMATTAPAGTPMAEYYLNKLKPQLRNWTLENYARPEGLTSCHGSANLKSYNIDETINEPANKRPININDLDTINNIFAPRQSSEIHMDHARFAHRMSAMLYRKRKSLAVTSPKQGTLKIGSKASRHNADSETEMLTMETRKKKNF